MCCSTALNNNTTCWPPSSGAYVSIRCLFWHKFMHGTTVLTTSKVQCRHFPGLLAVPTSSSEAFCLQKLSLLNPKRVTGGTIGKASWSDFNEVLYSELSLNRFWRDVIVGRIVCGIQIKKRAVKRSRLNSHFFCRSTRWRFVVVCA